MVSAQKEKNNVLGQVPQPMQKEENKITIVKVGLFGGDITVTFNGEVRLNDVEKIVNSKKKLSEALKEGKIIGASFQNKDLDLSNEKGQKLFVDMFSKPFGVEYVVKSYEIYMKNKKENGKHGI
ncbi:MAG: hypothetical protein QXU76_02965 [Candidatus Bilamarchaeaceae archaeon]